MYPQDFPVERVTPIVSLPMLLAGVAMLALAAWAGWAFARMNDRGRGASPRTVAASIHAAVQRKLVAALAAHGGATLNEAQALVDEIEIRLGHVLGMTGDLTRTDGALKDAIAGKTRPSGAAPPPASPATPQAVVIPIPGQTGASAAAAASLGAVGAAAVAESGGLVGAVLHLPPPPPPPAPPLSPAQHIASVRAALEAFAAYWGTGPADPARDARIDELEAAARQLSSEVPAPSLGPAKHA